MLSSGRHPRRHRFHLRAIALCLVLVLIGYIAWASLAVPRLTYAATVSALPTPNTEAMGALAWPAYGQAAVGTLDAGLLASNGSQSAVPIASIAKVMLALAVLREEPFDSGEQGETLTLTQSDVDIYNHYISNDGSVAKVAAGEKLTEYQALQALLLPSANNIADTLAVWAFGSVTAYVSYANDYADQLGLTQTHFNDASGFDPSTVSSAVNLIKIGQLALKNTVIAGIVAQPSATIPVAGTIRNVNALLNRGQGFIGLKTGNTDQAGGCMLFAANHEVAGQKITIVGAVLGAPDLATALRDSTPLLASAKQNFISTSVAPKGKVVGSYSTAWGGHVEATTTDSLDTVVWKGAALKPQVVITPIHAPAPAGQYVGKVLSAGATPAFTKSVSVHLAGDLHAPSWWWRVTHPAQII